MWPSSLLDQLGPESMPCRSNIPAKTVGASSVSQRRASGSASSAPSTPLTIGPWWVERTVSVSGARPLTAISSSRTSIGSHSLFEQVALAVDPLDEEVLDIGHDVGEGPADVVVLAHVDARQAGQGGPADEAVADPQVDLVPDARHARREVGVAGDQRRAGRAQRPRDGPVVGAGRLGGEADRAAHRVDLLDQGDPLARPGFLVAYRVADRVGRVELGGELRAEGADHVGAQQLPLPVGGQPEGEQLAEAEDVGGSPGLELALAQELHLEGQRPGAAAAAALTPAQKRSRTARTLGSSAASSR